MATDKQKMKAFEIAVGITKEAAKGGYARIAPAEVLEEVYKKALELLQDTQFSD